MSLPSCLVTLLPLDLLTACETSVCAAGVSLFLTGDEPRWMFYVAQGEVVLERHGMDGQKACLQRCISGFAGEASLTSGRYHCDARTTRVTRLVRLPIRPLRAALAADAAFAERWIVMLSQEVRRLRLQNERLSLPRVQDRLVHLIETEGQGGAYRVQGSVKSLAVQLAVSHEALYRVIGQLVAQGQLQRQGSLLRLQHKPG